MSLMFVLTSLGYSMHPALSMELPVHSCFSVTPKGQPEISVFIMDSSVGSAPSSDSTQTARIKFSAFANNDKNDAPDGYTIPLSKVDSSETLGVYRGEGFDLQIDLSGHELAGKKLVQGKLSLSPLARVIDPATQQPAHFTDKALRCAKSTLPKSDK